MRDLLEKSIGQYELLHELTQALEKPLAHQDAVRIGQIAARMEEVKAEIVETDRALNRELANNRESLVPELQARRLGLMKDILAKNRKLTPRIKAMMAVQSSELGKIRHGMKTIGHYAAPSRQRGCFINTAN